MAYSIYEAALLFFLYAFLGWCCEVIFAAVNRGVFVNRGFLNGPVCPIYGLGVVSVALLLRPVEHNLGLLFLGSMVLTSAIEYLLGLISDKLLHVRLWDYSDVPFNLQGYICLKFSLVWGLACVFIVRLIHPFFRSLVRLLPHVVGIVLIAVFSAMFLADLVITLVAALKLPKRAKALEEIETALRALSDGIGENLSDNTLSAMQKNKARRAEFEAKKKKLLAQRNRIHARLLKAYPKMHTTKHRAALEKLRAALKSGDRDA